MMQIIQLLPHRLVAEDRLRMRSLLPDLVLLGFVGEPLITKLGKQPIASLVLELLEDLLCGEAFQIPQDAGEIGSRKDGVKVIIQDHPPVDFEPLVFAAVGEGAHENIAARCRGEDGEPPNDGRRNKMSVIRITDPVAAAHSEGL